MTFILIIIVVICIADLFWFARLERREEELAEREAKVRDWKLILDRRFLESAREDVDYKEVYSSYTVTESDALRYNTDEDIFRYARKQIAANIARDIIKNTIPIESVNEAGMKVYAYKFRIRP